MQNIAMRADQNFYQTNKLYHSFEGHICKNSSFSFNNNTDIIF
jgi:hypothetical protein